MLEERITSRTGTNRTDQLRVKRWLEYADNRIHGDQLFAVLAKGKLCLFDLAG